MLTELRVKDLGVIHDLTLQLGRGLTAVTGETGAGKTLVVEAIGLLLGARADNRSVRTGSSEARVDGRFEDAEGNEVVLARALPAEGRSRAYVDGAPATAALLTDVAAGLVDMHGQHDHQALLTAAAQRETVDMFGGISTRRVELAQSAINQLRAELAALGGDVHARAREIELLRHQVEEISGARIIGADEEATLEVEEEVLADATAYREAAYAAREALSGEGGAADRVGAVVATLAGRTALEQLEARARTLAAEVDDLAREMTSAAESMADDPARLEQVQARRRMLRELRRKYGDSLEDVLRFEEEASGRLAFLEKAAVRSGELEQELTGRRSELSAALEELATARREAAGPLAEAVQAALRELALPRADVSIEVAGEGGSEVVFLLSANVGEPPRHLSKVASGGELSRTMLALRLVLAGIDVSGSSGKPSSPSRRGRAERPNPAALSSVSKTLVFDEVDAGIGGEAAVAVGRALAGVAKSHQVLVVTHLPQVAAFADQQIAVTKREDAGRTRTVAAPVEGSDRVVELSRMLSGQPASESAREHAAELLETAAPERALSSSQRASA